MDKSLNLWTAQRKAIRTVLHRAGLGSNIFQVFNRMRSGGTGNEKRVNLHWEVPMFGMVQQVMLKGAHYAHELPLANHFGSEAIGVLSALLHLDQRKVRAGVAEQIELTKAGAVIRGQAAPATFGERSLSEFLSPVCRLAHGLRFRLAQRAPQWHRPTGLRDRKIHARRAT